MKKRTIVLFILLAALSFGYAQQPKNAKSINSGDILSKALEIYHTGDAQRGLSMLHSIPNGDSLFSKAAYFHASLLLQNEQYEEAIKEFDYLLSIPFYHKNVSIGFLYMYKGVSYLKTNKINEAIASLEQAKKHIYYNADVHFHLAQAYFSAGKYQQAEEECKRAIFCSPYHIEAHDLLGLCYLAQRKSIPALLALNYRVFLDNNSSEAISTLQILNDIYRDGFETYYENNEIIATEDENSSTDLKRFIPAEKVLQSNYSLTTKYPQKSKIAHLITLQNQIIFENLPEPKNNHSVIDQLYLPFFKKIVENKKSYHSFCIYLLAGTDQLDKFKDKQAQIVKATNFLSQNILPIIDAQISEGVEISEKESFAHYFEYTDKKLSAFGEQFSKGENNNTILSGKWILIDQQGGINYILHANKNARNGIEETYADGFLKSKANYVNNAVEGTAYLYFPNNYTDKELISFEISYKNSLIDGIRKEYNRSGIITEFAHFKEDYYDGWVINYFPNGAISDSSFYESGVFQYGKSFYINGNIETIFTKNSDGSNNITNYSYNGKISANYTFNDGKVVGSFQKYYTNGNLQHIENYNSLGDQEGLSIYYYNNGITEEEIFYKEGKKEGKSDMFLESGFKYATNLYKAGILEEIITYTPDGSVRENIKPNDGIFSVDIYNKEGIRTCHYKVTTDEKYLENISFNSLQKPIVISKFDKNGDILLSTSIDNNGNRKSFLHYANNELNGLTLLYHNNDTLSTEGYYQNGKKVGAWYNYYVDGNLSTLTLYNDDNPYQVINYFPNGKRKEEVIFLENDPYIQITYDTAGNVMRKDTLLGKKSFSQYYLNGNVHYSGTIINGRYYGDVKEFDINGHLLNIENVFNGNTQDTVKIFYPSGQLMRQYYIENNEVTGTCYSYNENGTITHESQYLKSEFNGLRKIYTDDGKLDFVVSYYEDVREGIATYYTPEGTIGYTVLYSNNFPIGYSYATNKGKMSDLKLFTEDSIHFTCYYANGKKSMEITFNNGVRDGKQILYYANGRIAEVDNYANGNRLKIENYFSSGILKESIEYKDDCYHGKKLSYYPDGKIWIEMNYYYDMLHGPVKYYDKNGTLTKACEFFYGEQYK